MSETLFEIGEKEVINRLKSFAPLGQLEDDTVKINCGKKDILLNNDVMVENVHFSDQTTTALDVGWRAVSANLSDLAASGAKEIIGISIGLIAPPETSWCWVEGVYEGIGQALNEFGGEILGGDCSSGTQRVLSITAIGRLGKLRIHRGHALPGDQLIVSGPHGLSKLGLALLQSDSKLKDINLPKALCKKAILAHQRPVPPIKALTSLENSKPYNLPWRAGGTDSSDGLFEAIESLCISSNCQALLYDDYLPTTNDWPQGNLWDEWCLNGGEDFELVLSIPNNWAKEWLKIFPKCKVIGEIQTGPPKILTQDGFELILRKENKNHEHFKK